MHHFKQLPRDEQQKIENYLSSSDKDKETFLKSLLGDKLPEDALTKLSSASSDEEIKEAVASTFLNMYNDYMALPHYVRYKIDDTIRKFDTDGNGELDESEIQFFLADMGFEVQGEAIKYFIKANDLNGDGRLQFNECRLFVAKLYTEMDQISAETENREAKIKEMDVVYMTQQVNHDDPDIKRLNFQGRAITNEQVDKLCKSLLANTNVATLDLTNAKTVGNAAVPNLVELIKTNKTIKRLYLEGTSITQVPQLIIAMKNNKTITDMTVNEDSATDEDLDDLDDILERNEKGN